MSDSNDSNLQQWREAYKDAERRQRSELDYQKFRREAAPSGARRLGKYVIDLQTCIRKGQICLQILAAEKTKSGEWGSFKPADLTHGKISLYELPSERDLLWQLVGQTEPQWNAGNSTVAARTHFVSISSGHAHNVLTEISKLGLLAFQNHTPRVGLASFQPATQYRYNEHIYNLRLLLTKQDDGQYLLDGEIHSSTGSNSSWPISSVVDCIENFVFTSEWLARSDLFKFLTWKTLLERGPLTIPESELQAFLEFYFQQSMIPPIELPEEMSFVERVIHHPQVRIVFTPQDDSGQIGVRVGFLYQEQWVRVGSSDSLYKLSERIRIMRDLEYEEQIFSEIQKMGLLATDNLDHDGTLTAEGFVGAADQCLQRGWEAYIAEQKIRVGRSFQLSVKSGIDWFDVEAGFDFGDVQLKMPQLIHALRTGQRMISLGNGTTGLLPDAWFQSFSGVLQMARLTETGLQLNKLQTLFLTSTAGAHSQILGDENYRSLQKFLEDLKKLDPRAAHPGFQGELRPYQEKGLAWLDLLSGQNLGGILADDMGLGKTIQILALLNERYLGRKNVKPTLIVSPKSLLFNWKNEAKKFAPELKVEFANFDIGVDKQVKDGAQVLLVTYQSMRNHVDKFQKLHFDSFIVDEAQHVKNPQAQISVACRQISADRKFALTGTPVENSLKDLFSILTIVAPGLVSEAQMTRWSKETDPQALSRLARALKPFILRRTKGEVLSDLPEKSEQILYCELSAEERAKYDELKNHYWGQLRERIESQGVARTKFEVLEALLRLRQASCHQGLLDSELMQVPSAKFDVVLEQLEQVVADGHKALVFSQFTSLLALFNEELIKRGIQFEYLDGQTQNREERVQKFQNDPTRSVFVLSLKAGGVGLNLTAADYVYILDPWWNPAAETQAIDRAHRIGQTKKVFAYKVIAKDTVEEKILELQERKRSLADAIFSPEGGLLKELTADDLKDLFGG